MSFVRFGALRAGWCIAALLAVVGSQAVAQERGFRLDRYESTTAGSTQLLVDRPWYSGVRLFSVGVTGDYSHNALVPRVQTGRSALTPTVEHALVGHLDLAFSFFDRLQLNASLPLSFLETGTPELLSQVGPLQTVGLGDPRVGLLVRIVGQSERDAISLHLGASVWIPIGAQATHQGDVGVRLMPRAVLAGAFGEVGRWTVDAAFLYRPYASLGPPALGMTAASEARVGVALGASLLGGRLSVGPEARYAVQVVGANAFAVNGMNLEVLGALTFHLGEYLQLAAAGGSAFLGAPGTPDARALLRLAWAPRADLAGERTPELKPVCPEGGCVQPEGDDPDGDGIPTAADRCPYEPETKNGVRDDDGCPELLPGDGAALARLLAPPARADAGVAQTLTLPAGRASPIIVPAGRVDAGVATLPPGSTQPLLPPAVRVDAGVAALQPAGAGLQVEPLLGADAGVERALAFAALDSDRDGVPDEADRCPIYPEDLDGFEDEDGCPELDNDADGVPDAVDQCPLAGETLNGVDDEDGCPDLAPDADDDGVADSADRCPFEPENRDGVRDEDGCPEFVTPASPALAKLLAPPPVAGALPPLLKPQAEGAPSAVTALDSDGDGIEDEADRCPALPEDADGFEDEDGCREPDNDEDGVPDTADRCPEEAETFNGYKDDDGCPDEPQDLDKDGFAFEDDRCPLEPGIAPDGCPHAAPPALKLANFSWTTTPSPAPAVTTSEVPAPAPAPVTGDLDRDGVNDDEDPCPLSAEDRDGFEDEDGCPEPDNDQDGIPDRLDKCPFEAETINGIKDTDGCPDSGTGQVSVQKDAVVIDGVVQFLSGSATLQPASLKLIKQVASALQAHASLSIEIRGHTDDVGNAAKNVKLSQRRAEAIRKVLIKAGVAPTRLISSGYGPTRPIATNKTPAGREQNRRVEFLILGEKK